MRWLLALLIIMTPSIALGAENAGLVDGIWFSNNSPKTEEVVTLYVAVRNDTDAMLQGLVIFSVDGQSLSPVSFNVLPKSIAKISKDHTFNAGKHSVEATIDTPNAETVYLSSKSINVSSPPPETITEKVVDTSKKIVGAIDPLAQGTAEKVEKIRDGIAGEQYRKPGKNTSMSEIKEGLKDFYETSLKIAKDEDLPLWKRATALALSGFAIPLKYWMGTLSLFLLWIIWRMLRG